jgi:hypothetical protein
LVLLGFSTLSNPHRDSVADAPGNCGKILKRQAQRKVFAVDLTGFRRFGNYRTGRTRSDIGSSIRSPPG